MYVTRPLMLALAMTVAPSRMLIVPAGAAEPLMAGCRTEVKVTGEPADTVGVLVNSSPARYTNLPAQSYGGLVLLTLLVTVTLLSERASAMSVEAKLTGAGPNVNAAWLV